MIMKTYNEQFNVGKVKYVVNFHNGVSKCLDGSPFFDMRTFSNKTKKSLFIAELQKDGYIYGSI